MSGARRGLCFQETLSRGRAYVLLTAVANVEAGYNKDRERVHVRAKEKLEEEEGGGWGGSVSGVPVSGMRATAAWPCSSRPPLIGVRR